MNIFRENAVTNCERCAEIDKNRLEHDVYQFRSPKFDCYWECISCGGYMSARMISGVCNGKEPDGKEPDEKEQKATSWFQRFIGVKPKENYKENDSDKCMVRWTEHFHMKCRNCNSIWLMETYRQSATKNATKDK